MEHILELYSLKKRYWSMDFGVKMVDFLVEHKRLTKIGVKRSMHKTGGKDYHHRETS
jgi:hypothetical protein